MEMCSGTQALMREHKVPRQQTVREPAWVGWLGVWNQGHLGFGRQVGAFVWVPGSQGETCYNLQGLGGLTDRSSNFPF
jgi:hypothetical protein